MASQQARLRQRIVARDSPDTPASLSYIHEEEDDKLKSPRSAVEVGGLDDQGIFRFGEQETGPFGGSKRKSIGNRIYVTPMQRNMIALGLFAIAICTRFYKLHEPTSVVFDEVHFGKFASHYIKGTFYFDVHPPGGKLLFALAGWLAGYDGFFSFKEIHLDYTKYDVPYVAMRSLSALTGSALVPLSFLTIYGMGYTLIGALLAAVMVLLECSFVTQSRFILLDMPMLFFIACAVYSYTQFRNRWQSPFSFSWWAWLWLTGVFLGLSLSVKLVGLFVIAFIGLQTVHDLWHLLGDRRVSMPSLCEHFLARTFCLILTPLFVYVALWWVHFSLLTINGPGSSFMPPEFRKSLMEPVYSDEVKAISSGTQVWDPLTLISEYPVNEVTKRPYLHSHNHVYLNEGSSGQQQLTGYPFVDHNNWFSIHKLDENDIALDGLGTIKSGDTVYLKHVGSERGIYVHGFNAPVSQNTDTQTYYEVSAMDGYGHGWKLTIVETIATAEEERMQIGKRLQSDNTEVAALTQGHLLTLFHEQMGCTLTVTTNRLPDWGFHQSEIVCATNFSNEHSVWRFEQEQKVLDERWISLNPAEEKRNGLFTRLGDIWQYQKVAIETNNKLSKDHVFASRPEAWPALWRGISYWQDPGTRRQIYLLGNPLLYWSCLFAPPLYLLIGSILAIRARRGYHDMDTYRMGRFLLVAFLWIGYLLHFVPFFFMQRQLFLHHYLPAHYFMILAFAAFFDHLVQWLPSIQLQLWTASLLSLVYLYSFCIFAPLSYAYPMAESTSRMKWLSTWDFMTMDEFQKNKE